MIGEQGEISDLTPASKSVQTFSEVQASPNPTVEQTLNILDFEINRITEAHKRPGWTVWALCGSIVSAVWLITDQWVPGKTDVISVLYLFLLFSLIHDFISSTRHLAPDTTRDGTRGFTAIPLFDLVSPRSFLLTALHAAVLLSITLLIKGTLGILSTTIILFIYTIILLGNGYVFIASFFQTFMYISSTSRVDNKKVRIALYCLHITLSIILLWICSRLIDFALSQYNESITLSDVRIAGLLVIIRVLITWLAAHSSSNPLLRSLINIRRNLAFGRISVANAISQADIAITGMKLEKFMRDKLDEWLNYLERLATLQQQLATAFEKVREDLPEKDEDITEEHKKRAAELIKPLIQEVRDLAHYKDCMAKTVRSIERRVMWLSGLSKETEQLATDIIGKINKAKGEQVRTIENSFNIIFDVSKRFLRDEPETYEKARLKAQKELDKAKRRVKSINNFK